MSKNTKLTTPQDKAAPDAPNLDEVKSIPVGVLKFRELQDGEGMTLKSAVTSMDQRIDGQLQTASDHTMTFIPSLNSFRIKHHRDGKIKSFQIPLSNVSYWKVLNE